MANNSNNWLVGAGVVSVGAYVASGGAGSLTDIGIIIGGTSLDNKRAYHELKSDHHLGVLEVVKTQDMSEIKLVMGEADADRVMLAMDQPSANVSGTAPNKTLLHNPNSPVQLKQIQIVGVGPKGATGTAAARTVTAWKAYFKEVGPWEHKRDGEQKLAVTIGLLQDLSVSTSDKDWKAVDVGGA